MNVRRNPLILVTSALALLAGPPSTPADLLTFSSPADFDACIAMREYTLAVGAETFEENTMSEAEVVGMNDPLVQGVADGPFPSGLIHNLVIQSNSLADQPTHPSPRGPGGLAAYAPGCGFDLASDIVANNYLVDSLDLILPPGGNFRSIAFDAIAILPNLLEIRIYDQNDNLLGQTAIDAATTGTFIGFALDPASAAIARINLSSPSAWESADNIRAYTPEPAAATLLLVALAAAGAAGRSSSSTVGGRSSFHRRGSKRSASGRPPVWQRGQ